MSIIKKGASKVFNYFRDTKNKELKEMEVKRADEIRADFALKTQERVSHTAVAYTTQLGGEMNKDGKLYLFSHLEKPNYFLDQNVAYSPKIYEVEMTQDGIVTVNTPREDGLATITFKYDPSKIAFGNMHTKYGNEPLRYLGRHGKDCTELWKETGLVPQSTIYPRDGVVYTTDQTELTPESSDNVAEIEPIIGSIKDHTSEKTQVESGHNLFCGEVLDVLKGNVDLQNYIAYKAEEFGIEGKTLLQIQNEQDKQQMETALDDVSQ